MQLIKKTKQKIMGAILLGFALIMLTPVNTQAHVIFSASAASAATPLSYDTLYPVSVENGTPDKWFKFQTQSFDADYFIYDIKGRGEVVAVFDENGQRFDDTEGRCTFEKNKTYYIACHSHFPLQDENFNLKITYEKEHANTKQDAEAYTLGQQVYGRIYTRNDSDWFKFTTPDYAGVYNLTINYTENTAAYASLTKVDLATVFSNGEAVPNKELTLDANTTYYLCIKYRDFYGGYPEYSFNLSLKSKITPSITTPSITTPNISKLKAGKKAFSVKLSKVDNSVKYKIRYSTKKNMKGAKTINFKPTKSTIKKLKSGKKYYVQVRAYIVGTNGQKIYSNWSSTKSVKVK